MRAVAVIIYLSEYDLSMRAVAVMYLPV
jgi:hypothetical protein